MEKHKLTNKQIGEELQRERDQLAALHKATESLSIVAEKSILEVATDLANTIGSALGAHAVAIWKATEDKKYLKVFAHHGLSHEYVEYFDKYPYDIIGGRTAILAQAYLKNEPCFSSNIWRGDILGTKEITQKIPEKVFDMIRRQNFISIASFPMIVANSAFGVLNFYFKTSHAFSKSERQILEVAANMIAIAIGNSQYRQDLNVIQTTLRQERDQLEKLQQTVESLRILPEKSTREVLEELSNILGDALGARAVAIWTPTDDKRHLRIFLSKGLSEKYLKLYKDDTISINPFSVVGKSAFEKKPVFSNDLYKESRKLGMKEVSGHLLSGIKREGIASLASLPLIVQDKLFGILNFYFATSHEFSVSERHTLGVAANTTAIAIENIQHKKELEDIQKALAKTLKDTRVASEQAEEERRKTQLIINNFADGIFVLAKDRKIAVVNPRAEDIFNVKGKDTIGTNFQDVAKRLNLKPAMAFAGLESDEKSMVELTLLNGMTIEVSYIPIFSAKKQRVGTMFVAHDITREKGIERLKTEFVSLAAHQLRTPLSAIKWVFNLLMAKDAFSFSDEQTKLLKIGYDSNERMIALINELLNVTRIEEGKYLFNPKLENIGEIIESVMISRQGIVKRTRKVLDAFIDKNIPLTLIDKEKFTIAIQNLIDNAETYTQVDGEIIFSAKFDPKTALIKLSIRDTGIGIPESQQYRVFQRFFRATNATRVNTTGTGLGLYITKNIVEAHGGKIWFESEENKGTTFFIDLPIKNKETKQNA